MQKVSPYDSNDSKFNKKLKKLTDALQETKGTDSVMCLGYPAGGGTKDSKTQKHSENGRYKMMMGMYQTPTENSFPFLEAYLTEPGVDPVDSKGEVNASQVVFVGFGALSLAQLEMRQIKDETKGDEAFKVRRAKLHMPGPEARPRPSPVTISSPHNPACRGERTCCLHRAQTYYLSTMWNRPILDDRADSGKATINTNEANIGFWFTSFVVQKITIRNKTFGEIYAEIGGIWGASFALLAILFAKSGTHDKQGKEAYIFKFYLPSKKKQVVKAFAAANETAES